MAEEELVSEAQSEVNEALDISLPTKYNQEYYRELNRARRLYRVSRHRKPEKGSADTFNRDLDKAVDQSGCAFCELVETANKRKCYEVRSDWSHSNIIQ